MGWKGVRTRELGPKARNGCVVGSKGVVGIARPRLCAERLARVACSRTASRGHERTPQRTACIDRTARKVYPAGLWRAIQLLTIAHSPSVLTAPRLSWKDAFARVLPP